MLAHGRVYYLQIARGKKNVYIFKHSHQLDQGTLKEAGGYIVINLTFITDRVKSAVLKHITFETGIIFLGDIKFKAKDVQKILGIPKHRYEYIGSKIGIKPSFLEVEGRGRSHLYSFQNVLEFAFAHYCNKLGMGPTVVRKMLGFINV